MKFIHDVPRLPSGLGRGESILGAAPGQHLTRHSYIAKNGLPYRFPGGLQDNVMTLLLNPLAQLLRGTAPETR